MNLITNNLLQQELNKDTLNIIVIETENEELKKDLLSTKQNILFISESKQIHNHIGYNFVLCSDFIKNAKQLQDLSRGLHLPVCIYIDKSLPEELTKVDINQIQKVLSNILVVFLNEELEQNWSLVTTDTIILTKWQELFDLMKTKVNKI